MRSESVVDGCTDVPYIIIIVLSIAQPFENITIIAFISWILPVVVRQKGMANFLELARWNSCEWGFLVQVNFTKESYRRWLVDVYRVTTYNVKCMTLHGKRYIENVDREVRARKARIRIKNLISRHVSFSSWSSATVSPNIFRRSSTCTTGVLLAGASSTRRWSEDPAPSLLHPLTG